MGALARHTAATLISEDIKVLAARPSAGLLMPGDYPDTQVSGFNGSVATPAETLGPAQRADVIVDVTAKTGGQAIIGFVGREGNIAQASLARRPDIPPRQSYPTAHQLGGRAFSGGSARWQLWPLA